jgi:hypothetical protein
MFPECVVRCFLQVLLAVEKGAHGRPPQLELNVWWVVVQQIRESLRSENNAGDASTSFGSPLSPHSMAESLVHSARSLKERLHLQLGQVLILIIKLNFP